MCIHRIVIVVASYYISTTDALSSEKSDGRDGEEPERTSVREKESWKEKNGISNQVFHTQYNDFLIHKNSNIQYVCIFLHFFSDGAKTVCFYLANKINTYYKIYITRY